jgi:effector-binding domain-containing protein
MEVTIVKLEPKWALAIRDNCTAMELGNKFGELYGEIGKFTKSHSLEAAGFPFGIYHSFSPENVELEAGIPIKGNIKPEGRINMIETYGGKAAKTTYTGPYDNLKQAWVEFAKLVDSADHKLAGPCFEVYVTDPEKEPDSSKWITELYTPIV